MRGGFCAPLQTEKNHMTIATFADFDLPLSLVHSLERAGFTTPTPIQAKAIPAQLQGRDILGIAQTGSGKTAAFALPILAGLLASKIRRKPMSTAALVLAPTRELAVQIDEMIRAYAGPSHLTTALVLGGVSRSAQVQKLARGVDIVVATPGRLSDLLEDRKIYLGDTRYLVLDEADRMLDMGFIAPVRKIAAKCASPRQTALFSATMAPEIEKLAASLLTEPVRVEATPQGTTVATIDQRVIFADTRQKRDVLNQLLTDPDMTRVIVFARTKHGADKVSKNLEYDGHAVSAIHGNKSQAARQAALSDFRSGKVRLLVATDIAARGIDVPDISHVVNFDLPDDAENYVHRIGRTARNGATGQAISLVDGAERSKLRGVEKLIRITLPRSGEIAPPAGPAETVEAARGSAPRPKTGERHFAKTQGRPSNKPGIRHQAGNKPWWAKLGEDNAPNKQARSAS